MKDFNDIVDDKMVAKTHQLVMLTQIHSDKTLAEISREVFMVPPIDFNTAVWEAQAQGYISVDDLGMVTVLKEPEAWTLGDTAEHVARSILYFLAAVAKDEEDVEDNSLSMQFNGYAPWEVFTAMELLKRQGQVKTYTLEDRRMSEPSKKAKGKGVKPHEIVDTYTFYSLPGNEKHQWGKKQFKKDTQKEK